MFSDELPDDFRAAIRAVTHTQAVMRRDRGKPLTREVMWHRLHSADAWKQLKEVVDRYVNNALCEDRDRYEEQIELETEKLLSEAE